MEERAGGWGGGGGEFSARDEPVEAGRGDVYAVGVDAVADADFERGEEEWQAAGEALGEGDVGVGDDGGGHGRWGSEEARGCAGGPRGRR